MSAMTIDLAPTEPRTQNGMSADTRSATKPATRPGRGSARGRSPRTPGLAISGVLVTVGIAALAVSLIVAVVYLLS